MLTKEKLLENLKNVKEIQDLIQNYRKVLKSINLPVLYSRYIEDSFKDPRSETDRWGTEVHLESCIDHLYVYGIYLIGYYGRANEIPDYTVSLSLDDFIILEQQTVEVRTQMLMNKTVQV